MLRANNSCMKKYKRLRINSAAFSIYVLCMNRLETLLHFDLLTGFFLQLRSGYDQLTIFK
jgi:hypothetical protein